MTSQEYVAPVATLKMQAKRLRDQLQATGQQISHSGALELLARQYGVRDWNTLRAMAGNRLLLSVGDTVHGRYLGQAFKAEVRALTKMGDGSLRRITLHFDTAVDVVTFDSFSAFRQRVTGVIGWDGRSPQITSDGHPQLVIHDVA